MNNLEGQVYFDLWPQLDRKNNPHTHKPWNEIAWKMLCLFQLSIFGDIRMKYKYLI